MLRPINSVLIKSYSLCQPNVRMQNQPEFVSKPFELSGAEAGRAMLARNNVSFRHIEYTNYNQRVKFNVEINDNIQNPQCIVTLQSTTKPIGKTAINGIFLLALNDQLCEKENKGKIDYINSYLGANGRKIHIVCSPHDLDTAFNIIDKSFIHTEINPRYINEAKKIAPVGLFLYRKTGDFKEEFGDVPANIKEDEYERMIDKINIDDINDYNKSIIKNSDINIRIIINKTDYEENKNIIKKYIKVLNDKC